MEQCNDQLSAGYENAWGKYGFRTSQRKLKLNSSLYHKKTSIPFQDMGLKEVDGAGDGNVICKMEPYNLCYTLDDQGIMHPIGEHRPVRLLRIY